MEPGADLVEDGLRDLADGVESVPSLLVSIGAPRLKDLGLRVEAPFRDAEMRLYHLLAREDEDAAHSRYNALVRRLVSFEPAASLYRYPAVDPPTFRRAVEDVVRRYGQRRA